MKNHAGVRFSRQQIFRFEAGKPRRWLCGFAHTGENEAGALPLKRYKPGRKGWAAVHGKHHTTALAVRQAHIPFSDKK